MTLTTSKGKTYNANWAWAPSVMRGGLTMEIVDGRPLSQIAEEFDGVERVEQISDDEGNTSWEGYTVLASISRNNINKAVQIELTKEA